MHNFTATRAIGARRRDLLLLPLAALAVAPVRRVDPPAAPESGMPFLTTAPDGSVLLSWVDTLAAREHAMRFSRWTGSAWTAPETIASGANWFVNWADFGSLTALADGSLLAHWLTRAAGGGKFGYGIRIARRDPRSSQWREIHGISVEEPEDYAGFLTFAPHTGAATYLAPPAGHGPAHGAEHAHRKTARFLSFHAGGTLAEDREIDADVCSCCQTALGRTRSGWIAAYRDHQPGEIRDIAVTRCVRGAWTTPVPLHRDGWQINGCPTDGPSLVADGDRVAIAWLTRAGGTARVQAVLSNDGGARFGPPVRMDDGNPLGRPSIIRLDRDGFLVAWLEKTANGDSELRLRRLTGEGRVRPSFTVAPVPAGRASGFPKLAVTGGSVLVAWRDRQVRAALLAKDQF